MKWFNFKRVDHTRENLAYLNKKVLLVNTRNGCLIAVSLIKQIKENTWDKDLCDSIISELIKLSKTSSPELIKTQMFDSIQSKIYALMKNVNEQDEKILESLAIQMWLFRKDFISLQQECFFIY